MSLSSEIADRVAKAVLYEGYVLYPYRRSSNKNKQRWNFGVLYPEAWIAENPGSDRNWLRLEVLAETEASARISVTLRFLHLGVREERGSEWHEALERTVGVHSLKVRELLTGAEVETFTFEAATAEGGFRTESVLGVLSVSAAEVEGAVRVSVVVRNSSDFASDGRDEVLLRSLASAHLLLEIEDGAFVSPTDPPQALASENQKNLNAGVWPVLVGEEGTTDMVLGSPIILADYPQIAPESKGDLFDATEIDEILTLRILTLTDAEKAEMRATNEHARELLDRAESLSSDDLMMLHGTFRDIRGRDATDAWSAWDTEESAKPVDAVSVGGVEYRKGGRVRLRPSRRADAFDLMLSGKIAVIEAIEKDFEDNVHFAVVLEDDPGRDMGELRQSGHRFFFGPEEVERIES